MGQTQHSKLLDRPRLERLDIRFVLLKLHAKWLQFFVVNSHVLEFPGGITYCGKTAIYRHLQQQEHWHRDTRRPRVSQKLLFGPMAKLCPIWFWLCQVRISSFGHELKLKRNRNRNLLSALEIKSNTFTLDMTK